MRPPIGPASDDDRDKETPWRLPFGGLFGSHRRGPFAGRRGPRMFDSGALRLVVLGLIAEEPRHGYDIIRHLRDRFQGAYSPSPGSIYPLLKSLTEVGFVSAEAEGKKRLFTITAAGREWLEMQGEELKAINAQLAQAAGPVPMHRIGAAAAAFRAALFRRMRAGSLTDEEARRIVAIIDKARRELEGGNDPE